MLDRLFSSKIRARIFTRFYLSPKERYNAHELSIIEQMNYSSVWKELLNLESMGVLRSISEGGTKFYSIDDACPIRDELQRIVIKMEGVAPRITECLLQSRQNLKSAFIFGSFADGTADSKSDIDVCVVGVIDLSPFSKTISDLENEFSRQINYVVYPPEEWLTRKNETFIGNIIKSPKVFLIGGENDL